MKKTLAGLGVLALAAIGATGASFPANAASVQPVAEIVAASDAIIASPDAVLSQSEPVVTTAPAEIVAEPAAVVAEPVAVTTEPVVASEPVAVAPVAFEPAAVVTAEPVAAEPVTVVTEIPAVVADQVAAAASYAAVLAEGRSVDRYSNTQDATAARTDGYVYVSSVLDPSKVHVYIIPFEQVPVWTDADKAIPSTTWDTRTPEQVVTQEATQPAAELFETPAE